MAGATAPSCPAAGCGRGDARERSKWRTILAAQAACAIATHRQHSPAPGRPGNHVPCRGLCRMERARMPHLTHGRTRVWYASVTRAGELKRAGCWDPAGLGRAHTPAVSVCEGVFSQRPASISRPPKVEADCSPAVRSISCTHSIGHGAIISSSAVATSPIPRSRNLPSSSTVSRGVLERDCSSLGAD